MKNKLFGKATALVMGSLIIFSGQALAISSNNNKELTNAEALGESELIVAQANIPISLQNKIKLSVAIGKAFTTVGNAAAIANAASYANPNDRAAVSKSFADAVSIIGDSLAIANSKSVSKGQAAAVAVSLANAETVVGNATALAASKADSKDGPAIAKAGAQAKTVVGDATAVAEAVSQ